MLVLEVSKFNNYTKIISSGRNNSKSFKIREGAVGEIMTNRKIIEYIKDIKGTPIYKTECLNCGHITELSRKTLTMPITKGHCRHCPDLNNKEKLKDFKNYLGEIRGSLKVIKNFRSETDLFNTKLLVECLNCGDISERDNVNFVSTSPDTKFCRVCLDSSPEIKDRINQIYGNWEVLSFVDRKKGSDEVTLWKAQCTNCGDIRILNPAVLDSSKVAGRKNCKKCVDLTGKDRSIKYENLVGLTYSNMLVTSYFGIQSDKQRLWNTECINCKSNHIKSTSNLVQAQKIMDFSGIIQKCKDCFEFDNIGKRFANYVILSVNGHRLGNIVRNSKVIPKRTPLYECQCDCGRVQVFELDTLKKNVTNRKYCKYCVPKNYGVGDIIGKYTIKHLNNTNKIATLNCSCGSITEIKYRSLSHLVIRAKIGKNPGCIKCRVYIGTPRKKEKL